MREREVALVSPGYTAPGDKTYSPSVTTCSLIFLAGSIFWLGGRPRRSECWQCIELEEGFPASASQVEFLVYLLSLLSYNIDERKLWQDDLEMCFQFICSRDIYKTSSMQFWLGRSSRISSKTVADVPAASRQVLAPKSFALLLLQPTEQDRRCLRIYLVFTSMLVSRPSAL